jgi:hypothetical protein
MCFRLIEAKRAQHPVSLLCSVLGVSPAGYYAWKTRPRSPRARRDDELTALIRQIHDESEGSYGWPRIHAELRHRGDECAVLRALDLSGASHAHDGHHAARVATPSAGEPARGIDRPLDVRAAVAQRLRLDHEPQPGGGGSRSRARGYVGPWAVSRALHPMRQTGQRVWL